MSAYLRPYVGASVEAMASGTLREGPNAGKACTVTLYRGMASKGCRSNYTATPIRWYEVAADVTDSRGNPWRHCWSFSGRKYAAALALFERDVRELGLTVNIRPEVSDATSL